MKVTHKNFKLMLVLVIIILFIYFKTKSNVINNYENYVCKNGLTNYKKYDKFEESCGNNDFYNLNYIPTLKYLKGVYPLTDFSVLSPIKLYKFYNSLTFYYNCAFEAPKDDSITGLLWEKLPCQKRFPLPYTPKGYFYDFTSWNKNNTPTIFYDNDMSLNDRGSCRPTIAWTNKSRTERTGPGTMWTLCRTLQRDIWYPNGIRGNKFVMNKPTKWDTFLEGIADNDFIEVTHIDTEPGMVTSPGFWWEVYTGTGLFINVGKTLRTKNKIDAVFKLITEFSNKYPKESKQLLKINDPYLYIWDLYINCGNNSVSCNSKYTPCKDQVCNMNNIGVFQIVKPMLKTFKETVIEFLNNKNIEVDINNVPYIYKKLIIDTVINGEDYILYRWSDSILPDETLFFIGCYLKYDTIQFTFDANANGFFSFEILDLRLPNEYINEKLYNRDYSDFIDFDVSEIKNNPYNVNAWNNAYKSKFITDMITFILENEIITVRDPLNINCTYEKCKQGNNDLPCKLREEGIINPSSFHNFYCKNIPLSDDYKCLGIGTDYKDTVTF